MLNLSPGQFVDYIDVVMARLLSCVKDESRLVAQKTEEALEVTEPPSSRGTCWLSNTVHYCCYRIVITGHYTMRSLSAVCCPSAVCVARR